MLLFRYQNENNYIFSNMQSKKYLLNEKLCENRENFGIHRGIAIHNLRQDIF